MDSWTQTSAVCGCSRKNSAASASPTKNHRHLRLNSSGLKPLHCSAIGNYGNDNQTLSMASLQIKALRARTPSPSRPITTTTTTTTSTIINTINNMNGDLVLRKHSDIGAQQDNCIDFAGEETEAALAGGGNEGCSPAPPRVGFVDDDHVTDNHRGGNNRFNGAGRSSHCGASRNGHDVYSAHQRHAASRASRTLLNTVARHDDSSSSSPLVSRAIGDIVTHGQFVSRRLGPDARSHSDMPDKARSAAAGTAAGPEYGRERCRSSGGFASRTVARGAHRRGKSAGDRHSRRPCEACTHQHGVKGKQLESYENEEEEEQQKMYVMDYTGWRRLEGVTGQTEMPLATVSVPNQGLPKLTGLKHELTDPYFYERHREEAEMDMYAQMKQMQRHMHRHAARSADTKAKARPVTVVRKPDMLKHLEVGWQRLKMKQEESAVCKPDYQSLLEDILVYDIPGISHMQDDYTCLLDRPAPVKARGSNHSINQDITQNNKSSLPQTGQTSAALFLPSLVPGQEA